VTGTIFNPVLHDISDEISSSLSEICGRAEERYEPSSYSQVSTMCLSTPHVGIHLPYHSKADTGGFWKSFKWLTGLRSSSSWKLIKVDVCRIYIVLGGVLATCPYVHKYMKRQSFNPATILDTLNEYVRYSSVYQFPMC